MHITEGGKWAQLAFAILSEHAADGLTENQWRDLFAERSAGKLGHGSLRTTFGRAVDWLWRHDFSKAEATKFGRIIKPRTDLERKATEAWEVIDQFEKLNKRMDWLQSNMNDLKSMLAHLIDALAEESDQDERAVTDLDGRVVTLPGAANGSLDDA